VPLSEILHQGSAQDRLQRALAVGRLPHAYLFTGPDGIGKEMLATRLAAVLLCPHRQKVRPTPQAAGSLAEWQDACGTCLDCQLMAAGNHPDFHRIYRTLNKAHPDKTIQKRKAVELGIDVIRHFMIEKIGLRPARDMAKVFIVIEAERLSAGAQNAMLKTLEEPPGHSHLILLAASADTLLPTTRSRCHELALRTLPPEFIRRHLIENRAVSAERATFLAELSQGSLGAALRCCTYGLDEKLGEMLSLLDRATDDPLACSKALQDMAKALAETIASATKAATDEDEETKDLNVTRLAQTMVFGMVSTILRDVQRATVGEAAKALPSETRIARLARRTTTQGVRRAIQAVSAAEYHVTRNVNTGLIFDTLGIAIGDGLAPATVSAWCGTTTPSPLSTSPSSGPPAGPRTSSSAGR